MKFGLCYIPDYHEELSGSWTDWYEGMIAEVKLAELLGFHGAWFAEHRVPGFAFGSPAMFIAACARETRRIRLGCSVSLLPLNNPVRTAEDYVMADVLSGGRLDFGVGRGLYKYDYDMANVPMNESRERFDENLAIIRKLWTEEHITYRGRWTTIEGHTLAPRPTQQPCPPIWVAAVRTEDTYRWAGTNGFNLLTAPFFFPDHREQQALLKIYRDALRAAGHDPASKEIMAVYHMYCAERDDDVTATADPALGRYQAFTKATDMSRQAYRDPIAYKDWKGFFENRESITLDQMKASRAVIGRPEECIDRIRMLSERFGITYLCFEVNFGALPHARVKESMERFASQVMPAFAGARRAAE
jgi:alkanesulfonate monooxygenase SsuD/methylene tetrahydromethanopterin reductase-like flavin-dependent oxidoreductase (luciferase family)